MNMVCECGECIDVYDKTYYVGEGWECNCGRQYFIASVPFCDEKEVDSD